VSTTALLADGSLIGAAVTIAGIATAGTEFDPVRLAPQLDAVRQASDRARVYDYRITPGANDPMPSRPHGLSHVIGGGKMRSSSPAGAASAVDPGARDLRWRASRSHSLDYNGTSDAHSGPWSFRADPPAAASNRLEACGRGAGSGVAHYPLKRAATAYLRSHAPRRRKKPGRKPRLSRWRRRRPGAMALS
jgi:hypothetical protein